ncbi:MAG: methyltransferase domain-containing protein [Planctomycetota bacterium]|nr:methyltransferase domain-containing protein [Planctomycetota bacterium]
MEREIDVPLQLKDISRETGEHIIEGRLHCPDEACQQEYPILDGIPILVPSVRDFIRDHFELLNARDDLGAATESLLGDCAGPGSAYDYTRQMLSSYAWDHYSEFDPDETDSGDSTSVMCLRQLLERSGRCEGPLLDLGCATGRHTFELATHTDGLVLGIDLNFAMLRVASRALREGVVRYPRRRIGIAYDRRTFPVSFEGSERVDFWLCDAQALPLRGSQCGGVAGMNVLDSVASPLALLQSIARVLGPLGTAYLACPYDWSGGVTPVESWIGGHSQRGEDGGAAESRLRSLLTSNDRPEALRRLRLVDEFDDLTWKLRQHDRSHTVYRLHGLIIRSESE